MEPLQIGKTKLNEFQISVFNECVLKGSGGMSIPLGSGKCHGIDTKILMYDGEIKLIQDIKEGDIIMGDDSTPRKILSLARGEDEMYEVIPIKGEKYIVNQEHILCLKISGFPLIKKVKNSWHVRWIENMKENSKSFRLDKKNEAIIFLESIEQQEIVEISIKDYLKLSKSFKSQLKGYRVSIDFSEKELPFDPYIIGFWLGDGSSEAIKISCQDSTILHYLDNNLTKYNLDLIYASQYDYYISGFTGSNILLTTLKTLNLII